MDILGCAFIAVFLKNILFMGFMFSENANIFMGMSNWFAVVLQIFITALIFAPALLFKKKGRYIYCILIDTIISVLFIIDLWYYRGSWTLYSLKYLYFDGLFNVFNRKLINPSFSDIFFIIDLPFFYRLFYKKSKSGQLKNKEKFSIKSLLMRIGKSSIAIAVCIIFFITSQYAIETKGFGKGRYNLDDYYWSPHAEVKEVGPIGFHYIDTMKTLRKIKKEKNETEIEKAKKWIEDNDEKLPDNKYYGMFKGKNVIFLQLESYEEFILNKKVYGQEITPNLNRLMKNSINFTNIYEQNNGGNSIDCDVMVNASTYTLGSSITGLSHEETVYKGALPRVLANNGYTTVSTKAERGLDWNWGEIHKSGFGVQNLWDEKDYKMDDIVGFGLSDKSVLTQFREKLKTLKQPFSAFTVTITTHGPFTITDNLKELKLPEELNKNYLGNYFQALHYSDKQIGAFIDGLDKDGILDNTIVVLYGDHGGVHKYYNDKIQNMTVDGDWWREYNKKIPFMIYAKGFEGVNIDAAGGQTDFYPTIAYLLGIDKNQYKDYVMGRNLLNTKRTATVIKNNEIKGTPSSEEEKQHLLNAYDVGRIIIENNMFK